MEEFMNNDNVNHPKHYTNHPSGVEAIEITEHFNFNKGNAIKYIWRSSDKGKEVEDLRKARWYIDREIARILNNEEPTFMKRSDEWKNHTNDQA